jgi:hypothetical protein
MHMLPDAEPEPDPDPEPEDPEPPLVLPLPEEPPWPAVVAAGGGVVPEALEGSGLQAVRDSPPATTTRARTESLLLLRIASP